MRALHALRHLPRTPPALRAMSSSSIPASPPPPPGPIAADIHAKCLAAFRPTYMEIENESSKHGAGSAESHFKLFIVSPAFEGVPLLARHRLVQDTIRGAESNLPCHALSISAKTPAQWQGGAAMHKTPDCGGGGQ
jgi:stress-induced morphogen